MNGSGGVFGIGGVEAREGVSGVEAFGATRMEGKPYAWAASNKMRGYTHFHLVSLRLKGDWLVLFFALEQEVRLEYFS